MFDCVLNTPLNIITFFFAWRSQSKVNDFLRFSSAINFFYKYLPEAKVYLEVGRTSTSELFRQKFILQNLQENTFARVSL